MNRCDNCGAVLADDELTYVKRWWERVDGDGPTSHPGDGPTPTGECPRCGALCYPAVSVSFTVTLTTDDIVADDPADAVAAFKRVVTRGGRTFTVTDEGGARWLVDTDTGETSREVAG